MIPITSPNVGLENDKYMVLLTVSFVGFYANVKMFWFSLFKVRYYTQYYCNYVSDRLLPVCTGRVVHFYACII